MSIFQRDVESKNGVVCAEIRRMLLRQPNWASTDLRKAKFVVNTHLHQESIDLVIILQSDLQETMHMSYYRARKVGQDTRMRVYHLSGFAVPQRRT